jgi:hypothetical protein
MLWDTASGFRFSSQIQNPRDQTTSFAPTPASRGRRLRVGFTQTSPVYIVDPRFASLESDLLFHVQDTEALVYLLFEHQSREHPWMAVRLLSYVVRIWITSKRIPPPKRCLRSSQSVWRRTANLGQAAPGSDPNPA